jgi:hypothetical protein
MLDAGAPVSPDVFMNPAGRLFTPDMLEQVSKNIFAAGAPVRPDVFRKSAGKFVNPVMPLNE